MALVAEAQAVATASFGPRAPNNNDTLPLAALTINFGIVRFDPEHPHKLEQLLKRAGELIYENKCKKLFKGNTMEA